MKLTTTAGGLSILLLLTACVHADQITAAPDAPMYVAPETSDFEQQAAELPAALIHALKRDLGMTGAEYLAAGHALSSASQVVDYLAASGIDPNQVYLDGTTLKLGEPGWAELATTVGAISAAPFAPATPSQARIDASNTSLEAIDSLSAEGASFRGGMPIGANIDGAFKTVCTAGLNGYNTSLNAGRKNLLLTAGECMAETTGPFFVSDVTTAGTSGVQAEAFEARLTGTGLNEIGGIAVIESPFIPWDATNYINTSPKVANWGGGSGAPEAGSGVLVRGTAAPVVGAPLCKSAPVSGWTCGQILAVGFGEHGQGMTNFRTFSASVCVLPTEVGAPGMSATSFIGIARSSTWDANCDITNQSTANRYAMFLSYNAVVSGDVTMKSVLGSRWEPAIAVPDPTVTSIVDGTGSNCIISGTILSGFGYRIQIEGFDNQGEHKIWKVNAASNGTWTVTTQLNDVDFYQIMAKVNTWSTSTVVTRPAPSAC